MSYKIVAYGPDKSCLTWARDQISLEAKEQYLRLEGYTDFRIEEEKHRGEE